MTEKGQDAGFPIRREWHSSPTSGFAWQAYRGNPVDRPLPQLSIGDKPFVPKMPPYRFQFHVDGSRGVPLVLPTPIRTVHINPVLEWDTNNPIDGIAGARAAYGADNNLFGAVYGILDTGPEESGPHLAGRAPRRIPRASRIKWSQFAPQYRARAECLPEAGESRRPGAAQ